jgi:CHAT domain-containing protein
LSLQNEAAEAERLQAYKLLSMVSQQAHSSNDYRMESFALIQIAQLYQDEQRHREAAALLRQASQVALMTGSESLVRRWKIEQTLAEQKAGLTISKTEFHLLCDDLLQNQAGITPGDFHALVRPLFVAYLDQLYEQQVAKQVSQAGEAYYTIDSLRFIEFMSTTKLVARSHIVTGPPMQPGADYYGVTASDAIYIVVDSESGNGIFRKLAVSEKDMGQRVSTLHSRISEGKDIRTIGKQIHDDLIRPVQKILKSARTIRFSLDGMLRNLPMAALYGDTAYLIEQKEIGYFFSRQLRYYEIDKNNHAVSSDSGQLAFMPPGSRGLSALLLERQQLVTHFWPVKASEEFGPFQAASTTSLLHKVQQWQRELIDQGVSPKIWLAPMVVSI